MRGSEAGSLGSGPASDGAAILGKVLGSWASLPVEMEKAHVPSQVVGRASGLVCGKGPASQHPPIQVPQTGWKPVSPGATHQVSPLPEQNLLTRPHTTRVPPVLPPAHARPPHTCVTPVTAGSLNLPSHRLRKAAPVCNVCSPATPGGPPSCPDTNAVCIPANRTEPHPRREGLRGVYAHADSAFAQVPETLGKEVGEHLGRPLL